MSNCEQCGAPGGRAECGRLFDALLVLEFRWEQPWGPLHGLTVATFSLQHPVDEMWSATSLAGAWASLDVFVHHGLGAADYRWRQVVAGRQGMAPTAETAALGPPAPPYPMTIVDVAGPDGSFPTEGHLARVTEWATSTYHARRA